MALKDIAVHVDDSARCEARVDLALALAKRDGAGLRGVFAQSDPNVPGVIRDWPTQYFREAGARVKAMFHDRAAQAGVAVRWHEVPSGEHAYIIRQVTAAAAHADLIVMGQHDPEKAHGLVPPDLVEQVVLHSGRPVLIVPYVGKFPTVGERPLIAWNDGREAARALNDALQLASHVKECRLVIIGSRRGGFGEDEVVHHLACHGIKAEIEHLVAEEIGVMDLLLSRVADTGADLLVMGAHGNYGFPNLHRGGGTRYVLGHMTVPVLMSH